MKSDLRQGMAALGSALVALGLAGCGGGGGGGGLPDGGTTVAPAGASVKVFDWNSGELKDGSDTFSADYKTDQNGSVTTATVKYGSTVVSYADCRTDASGNAECLSKDSRQESRLTVSRNVGGDVYEHLRVIEWASESRDRDVWAVSVKGNETPLNDMPRDIKATYSGSVSLSPVAPLKDADGVGYERAWDAQGRATYAVDFGSGRITGKFTDLRSPRSNAAMDGQVDLSGTIKGNAFSVDSLSGSYGNVTIRSGSGGGKFYGPKAAELGGTATFDATCGDRKCSGLAVFTGKKQ